MHITIDVLLGITSLQVKKIILPTSRRSKIITFKGVSFTDTEIRRRKFSIYMLLKFAVNNQMCRLEVLKLWYMPHGHHRTFPAIF